MKRITTALFAVAITATAGCTGSYTTTQQPKMQAAHHWEILAQYEAERITQKTELKRKPIYVESTDPVSTPFSTAFHSMLIGELTQQGMRVVQQPMANAITVSYHTQVLRHTDRGYSRPEKGKYVTISGDPTEHGIAPAEENPPTLTGIPVVIGSDPFTDGQARIEPVEVIISTEVTEDRLVLMLDTTIFYLNSGDVSHYAPVAVASSAPTMKYMKLVNQ